MKVLSQETANYCLETCLSDAKHMVELLKISNVTGVTLLHAEFMVRCIERRLEIVKSCSYDPTRFLHINNTAEMAEEKVS